MKRIKLVAGLLLCLVFSSRGQDENPVHWTFSSKKLADKTYELHFKAFIDPPWHIYAQNNDADVTVPTSIAFDSSESIDLIDKPKEVGSIKMDSVSGVLVRYYENEVEFVQTVKLKSKTKTSVRGKISWIACTERCLPEAERNFSMTIGQ